MRSTQPSNFTYSGTKLSKKMASKNLVSAARLARQQPISDYCAAPASGLSISDASLLLRKRASAAVKQKDYAQALGLFDRLVDYDPANAESYANRGLVHYSLNNLTAAMDDYNRALVLDPTLDKAYNNRANLNAVLQNWGDAIDDYDEAIDLNPLNTRARINQAITFREIGDYDEALACLDIAMFFKADSANLYAERGRTYHLQGEWNCAIADYRKALSLIEWTSSEASVSDDASSSFTQSDALTFRVLKWMNSLTAAA